jgi:hypothetical protein
VLQSLPEVEFGMPEQNVRRGCKQTPASRFNRLRDLKQQLGERRKRQVESGDYSGAEIMFSGFNLRR